MRRTYLASGRDASALRRRPFGYTLAVNLMTRRWLFVGAIALPACAAVLGIEAPEHASPADGGAADATPDAPVDAAADAPPPAATTSVCAAEPACDATPDPAKGLFVDGQSGADPATCGALEAPCPSIAAALARANAAAAPLAVYVAPGTYTESLALHPRGAIVGGFRVDTGRWVRRCTSEAIALVTIVAPTGASRTISAVDLGGIASLDTLTVRSKAGAQASESLYGVFASGTTTTLCLANVVVEVAAAGSGADGTRGGDGALAACDAGEDGGWGAPGEAGAPASGGAFTASGWDASAGSPGGDGTRGAHGLYEPGSCSPFACTTACQRDVQSVCVPTNAVAECPAGASAGCGGGPGQGGGGGASGGSSVALYAFDATVDVRGGRLGAGAGGSGGRGADGGAPAVGKMGDGGACTICDPDAAVCATPLLMPPADAGAIGPGGSGGGGGTGGAGAAGFSCAAYAGPAAKLALDEAKTQLVRGAHGQPGDAPAGDAGVATPAGCR